LDFSQEHAADLTALPPSPQQVFSVELGHPDARIHPVAFRHVVQPDPVGDEPAPNAGLPHDRPGAAARGLQSFHQPKPSELRRAPLLGDTGVVLEDLGALTTTNHRGSRRRASPYGHHRGTVRHDEESPLPTEFLLHGSAQIEHQMESIRNLCCLVRPAAQGIGVWSVTVAADDPDAGMRREPRRARIGGAHGEHIDDAATLQIDQDRAEMLLALLPRPVIDAQCRSSVNPANERPDVY
jgi:hypothetical protein